MWCGRSPPPFYNDVVGRLSPFPWGARVENDYGVMIHHLGITLNDKSCLVFVSYTSSENVVASTGAQGSGILSSLARANCYIVLPSDQGGVKAGEMVNVQLFDHYL